MNFNSLCQCAALSAALSFLVPVASAYAELGGTVAQTRTSSPRDTQSSPPVSLMNGAVLMRTSVDAGGTTVNEYASSTGQIFAYTWQGPTMPDLPALLGPYNASWRAGASASASDGRDLHASRVARPDVVVESGGQMRSYAGRAWLPAALPAGVTPDELH